ncbi:MAG: hypothetical protein RIR79_1478 [Pseudomonadota bacterium]|jgi:hypothetical protein
MEKIGLACEGVTDRAVIKNILCGYFSIQSPQRHINELSPPEGGWRPLLNYLKTERFRDDVESHSCIILQIDTDVSADFGVQHTDDSNNPLSVIKLIERIVAMMVAKIADGDADFYADNSGKIIFAICVHSIECWLLVFYDTSNAYTIDCSCEENLRKFKFPRNTQLTKKPRNYEVISAPFLESANITTVAAKNESFNYFIQQLQPITISTSAPS